MSIHSTSISRRRFVKCASMSLAGLYGTTSLNHVRAAETVKPRFELSLHQYSLKPLLDSGKLETSDYPDFAKQQFGIDNVEFAVEYCEHLKQDLAQAANIAERSRKLKIEHRVLLCGGNPALDASSEQERRAALADHLKWAEVAKRLRCKAIRVRASSEGDKKRQLEFATQGIGNLCDALADSPIAVRVENIGGFSRDPQWLVELVQRIGNDRVGLIADFANFNGDIYQGMSRLLPYTKSICTKSWQFDVNGNETKIDFAKMMRVIKDSDFQGCIAIEYLGDEPVSGVKQTADLIRKHS